MPKYSETKEQNTNLNNHALHRSRQLMNIPFVWFKRLKITKLHVVSWEEKMAPVGFHKRLKMTPHWLQKINAIP